MSLLDRLVSHADRLDVAWSDGVTTSYPWLWIRDHAHDAATLHPITQQRQLYTAGVPAGLRAASCTVVDDQVVTEWVANDDGTREPTAVVPIAFLHRFRQPTTTSSGHGVDPILWDRDSLTDTPQVAFDAIMSDEAGVLEWLTKVAQYGFCIATGTPADVESTEALVRRVGYVRETIFGGFWEFTADLSKADTAYTNLELRPHTDGTYSHDAPGLQLLHCLAFDGEGGESTMVDGFRIAADIEHAHPHLARTLSTVAIPGHYLGDGAHLIAERPVLRHDHTGRLVQVSFNNADRAPFLLPLDEMRECYAAIVEFDRRANDERSQWRHVLRPGEALLFDNWRVLHGRTAYSGHRRLCGAYLNHEDFESRLRMAAIN